MASVGTIYDTEGRPRGYQVRGRTSSGRHVKKFFPKGQKGAAERFAVQLEADKVTGAELDGRGALMTVADYVADWRKVQRHRPGSVLKVTASLAPMLDRLGDYRLGKVRQSDIRGWVKERAAEVAPSTMRVELGWVRAVFRSAVADRLIGFNPCDGVAVEAGPRRVMRLPDAAGVAAIAAGLPERWGFIGPLGARTGLRPAELLGLTADRVDWMGLTVTVDRQLVRGQLVDNPKTAAGRRVVPVDSETVELLSAQLVAYPLEGGPGLIFHRPGGGPLSHRAVNSTWAGQAARAGWAGIRLHDMRHFYATEMLAAGLSVAEVAALLGHADPSITARVYAHARPTPRPGPRRGGRRFLPRPQRALDRPGPPFPVPLTSGYPAGVHVGHEHRVRVSGYGA